MGLIKFDKPKEEKRFYPLWGDDSSSTEKANHLAYIPAPKPKLPGIIFQPPFWILNVTLHNFCEGISHQFYSISFKGHEESYNPSLEYIPTQEEINSYQLMYDEDRPKFIPRR